jgi:hypothetical protein
LTTLFMALILLWATATFEPEPEELVGITGLQELKAALIGARLLWDRHTKTYSSIWQVPQFWWWLYWEVA